MAKQFRNRIARNTGGVAGRAHDQALGRHTTNVTDDSNEFDVHMDSYELNVQKPTLQVHDELLFEEPAGERGQAGQFTDAATALRFMLAGSATLTIVGKQRRYTYKVTLADKNPVYPNDADAWFVALLSGPDNESDFQYLGMIKHNRFNATRASKMREGSVPFDAFAWVFHRLATLHRMPTNAQLWHEGRCGRCNRKLTVPSSIASGFGPECIGKVGL